MWLYLIIIFGGLGADQLSKWIATKVLTGSQPIFLIPNTLGFLKLHNQGAAYNLLAGQLWFFLLISGVSVLILGYYLIHNYRQRPLLSWGLALLLAGTLGNACDRLFSGYVVDFIYLNLANLPFLNFVCNLADIFITIGVIFLLGSLLKSEDKGY
ncbi:signal peptidase II [Lactobacillus sp. DCY120]|uniref:Lipoprotein signal peptidase n=1 Tax=Bombilactobacillus apium TaxID=2675299 RepID=A0A850RAF5_9LACO|nr:signal peptidase II [Bombilactobacillus apium]NVY95808.1 signal peptidase II [Bombilactobacillus apium]